MVFATLHIVVAERLGLRVVDFQTVGDGLRIVVGAAGLLSALDHAVYELAVGYFQSYDGIELGAPFLQQFIEGLSLWDRAGKSVEDHSVGCFGVLVDRGLGRRQYVSEALHP